MSEDGRCGRCTHHWESYVGFLFTFLFFSFPPHCLLLRLESRNTPEKQSRPVENAANTLSPSGVLPPPTGYNAFDNDPWILRLVDFAKAVLAQDRVKMIGVCYGHQIVGRALGARVERSGSGEWEVSVCRVQQTEVGREWSGGMEELVSSFFLR